MAPLYSSHPSGPVWDSTGSWQVSKTREGTAQCANKGQLGVYLTHPMLGPVLQGAYSYPYFTDGKAEARREVRGLPEVTGQVSGKTDSNSGLLRDHLPQDL